MKILFINYGPYTGCSGVHIHFLAQTLTELGHECLVCLPLSSEGFDYFGPRAYTALTVQELNIAHVRGAVVHAWTPREFPRQLVQLIRTKTPTPYFVHLEDNELEIAAQTFGVHTLEEQKIAAQTHPELLDGYTQTNPLFFEEFLQNASGVTCIIKKLEEFVPQGVPRMTFWPACEDTFFHIPAARPQAALTAMGIGSEVTVLAYPGAVHSYNKETFFNLLKAMDMLAQQGKALTLLRAGIEYDCLDEQELALYQKYVVRLQVDGATQLPAMLALADILVQPGRPGPFDNYRFPSKAPMFLASGRPVMLPATNVAESLRHGKDCLLLREGTAEEIARYLDILMQHPDVAQSIGRQGRASARRLFSWKKSAEALVNFYAAALG